MVGYAKTLHLVVSVASVLYFTLFPYHHPLVDIMMWFTVVVSTVYAAEVSMALYRARLWYNVMVVSLAVSLPQTLIAVKLAHEGKPLAAWIDTIGSTIVDSVLVTAVLRRYVIGRFMWRYLGYMVVWSVFALYVNYHTYAMGHANMLTLPNWALIIAGLLLPALLVREYGLPSKAEVLMLLNHGVATGVASYFLADALAQLHVGEVQLGVLATILATLPDFLVALLIRSAVASILGALEAEDEAVATMLAAATHDQLLIPALILLFAPEAAASYPHWFNVAAVALKFTLLSRRAYWLIGVPTAILVLLFPPIF